MIGCPTARWCAVACLLGDESQHPTWPHVMQMRRCTQRSPMRRQSSQPRALGMHALDLIRGGRSGARRRDRARRRVRCRSSVRVSASACSHRNGVERADAEERRRLRERVGRAGEHQLVAGPDGSLVPAASARSPCRGGARSTNERQLLEVVEADRRARRPGSSPCGAPGSPDRARTPRPAPPAVPRRAGPRSRHGAPPPRGARSPRAARS